MSFKIKLLKILGYTETVEAFESWIVRWRSASAQSTIAYIQDEAEVFVTKQAANQFADSLRKARQLCKDGGFSVSVEKNK